MLVVHSKNCVGVYAVFFLIVARTAISATLPEGPLIAGYQNWGSCNVKETVAAVERGVNVVIWFAIDLIKDVTNGKHIISSSIDYTSGKPIISSGIDFKCVAKARAAIAARGMPTAHLIAIGGWNAPHPDTSISGEKWFEIWDAWNSALPMPFDGFDWDLEGHDDVQSPTNSFTFETLNLAVDMSISAKAAGYIVTMVPAQSYLDTTSNGFSLSLLNSYPDWHPEFTYRGRNCYAYLLLASPPGTFDLVLVQLYEGWSRAGQALYQQGVPAAMYLLQWTSNILDGWEVDFGQDSFRNNPAKRVHGKQWIHVEPRQLLIGFSFGPPKMVLFRPEEAAIAYIIADPKRKPRGYFFWNIQMDNEIVPGTSETLSLASGLNQLLHIRS